MTGLAELLTTVWEAITSCVAPYQIVPEWQSGVKTRLGKITKTCRHTNGVRGTGLHFYWPIIGGIDLQDTNTSTIQTDDQTLTTRDNESIVVAMTIAYRIKDAGRFYKYIHDQDETIQNVVESEVGRAVPQLDWWQNGERDNWGLTENLVTTVEGEITPRLRRWGIEVIDVATHTMTRARTYRLIT